MTLDEIKAARGALGSLSRYDADILLAEVDRLTAEYDEAMRQWKIQRDDAVALTAQRARLLAVIGFAAIPLEALNVVGAWEIAPPVKRAIAEACDAMRAAIAAAEEEAHDR